MMQVTFSPFPEMETERLSLRRMTMDDVQEVFFFRSDPAMRRYIDRPPAETIEDARAFIARIDAGIDADEWINWGMYLKNDRRLIGTICLWNLSRKDHYAETGYLIHTDFQRRGLMSEAMKAMLEYAFEKKDFLVIEAFTHRLNTDSARLLVRNGFVIRQDATDPYNRENVVYRLEKGQFKV